MAFPTSGSTSCIGRQGPNRNSISAAISDINGNGNQIGGCRYSLSSPCENNQTGSCRYSSCANQRLDQSGRHENTPITSITGTYQPPLVAPPLQPFTVLPVGYTQQLPPPARCSITSSAGVRPLSTSSSMSMMPTSPRDSVMGTVQLPTSAALPYMAASASKAEGIHIEHRRRKTAKATLELALQRARDAGVDPAKIKEAEEALAGLREEAAGTIMNAKPFNSFTVSELIPADANWHKVTCEYKRPSVPTIETTELHSEAARARSPSIPRTLTTELHSEAARARSPSIPRTLKTELHSEAARARSPLFPRTLKTELHSEAARARSPSFPRTLNPTVTEARYPSPAIRSKQWQPSAAQAGSPSLSGLVRPCHPTMIPGQDCSPRAQTLRPDVQLPSSPRAASPPGPQHCSPRAQIRRPDVQLPSSAIAASPGPQRFATSPPGWESADASVRKKVVSWVENLGDVGKAALNQAWQSPRMMAGAAHQKHGDSISSCASTAVSPTPVVFDFSPMSRMESFQNARVTSDVMAPSRTSSKKKKWVSKLPVSSNTQLLHSLGRDLTQSAANGELDPLIGREKELEQMIQVLARRRKNNPLMIGDPGVGKTAVVEGLAQQIVNGEVPDMLAEKHIFQIPVAGLLAGTTHRGEFEARMKALIDEVVAANDHVILFIDEIHSLVGAGRSGNSSSTVDAAGIMKPVLARGEFQCIGATTLDDYRVHFEKEASLERRFQPITVRPTDIEETVLILTGLAPRYEDHHHVKYSEEAIRACVKFAAEYMPDRFLPDKAIDVFDEVGAFVQLRHQNAVKAAGEANDIQKILASVKDNEMALHQMGMEANSKVAEGLNLECQRLKSRILSCQARIQMFEENAKQTQAAVVTEEDVARVISTNTGIPLEKLSEDESMRMLNLEEQLNHRIVGQDPAIAAVSKALRRARVGLKSPNRPIASFLFCGPTGVGKTELCKALSDVYFGQDNAMIRLDMSEFMEMHSVSKLIGSPAGYIGYGDENQLTDRIRRKPYTLVLFDEIEKAHSAVLNILLQVMDDGCLTDATGRNVSFKNALIIMTSNAGHQSSDLQQFFSPEFLNRLDGIIPFSPLGKSQVEDIAELEFAKTRRHVEEHGATLTLSPRFKDKVIDEGFDAAYGARPLRRTVASLLGDELANTLLSQSLEEGEHVHVDVDRDQEVVVSRSGSRRNSKVPTVNLAEDSPMTSPNGFSNAANSPRNSISSSRRSAAAKPASPQGANKQSIVGESSSSPRESLSRKSANVPTITVTPPSPTCRISTRDLECPFNGNFTNLSIDTCTDSDSTRASDADHRLMFPGPSQSPGQYRPKSGSC